MFISIGSACAVSIDDENASSNNKILNNNENILDLTSSLVNTNSSTVSFSISQIVTAANTLKLYVLTNKKLPTTITVGNVKVSIEQFSYLMSVAIKNINRKNTTKILLSNITVSNSTGNAINKTIKSSVYLSTVNNVVSFINSNKRLPNYVTIDGVKTKFKVYTYCFAKILAFYKSNKRLPNTCLFNSSVFKTVKSTSKNSEAVINNKTNTNSTNKNSTITVITYKKGINEISTITNLSDYLKSNGYTTITTAIKNLSTSLTKNCTTSLEKAESIFNYVKNNITYNYYSNSKYGASGTLSYKKGNCCDHANLIVALCRASGIGARYCYCKSCTFSRGLSGHVWAQIYVDGVWYAADTTSAKNSLGVIKNWNINSFTLSGQYATLPF